MNNSAINESISILHNNDVMDILYFFGDWKNMILKSPRIIAFFGRFGAGNAGSSEIYSLTNSDF
jgi:hypothetical protein